MLMFEKKVTFILALLSLTSGTQVFRTLYICTKYFLVICSVKSGVPFLCLATSFTHLCLVCPEPPGCERGRMDFPLLGRFPSAHRVAALRLADVILRVLQHVAKTI